MSCRSTKPGLKLLAWNREHVAQVFRWSCGTSSEETDRATCHLSCLFCCPGYIKLYRDDPTRQLSLVDKITFYSRVADVLVDHSVLLQLVVVLGGLELLRVLVFRLFLYIIDAGVETHHHPKTKSHVALNQLAWPTSSVNDPRISIRISLNSWGSSKVSTRR